jgi:hypothetical protein
VLNTLNRARFTVAVDSFIKTGESKTSLLVVVGSATLILNCLLSQ